MAAGSLSVGAGSEGPHSDECHGDGTVVAEALGTGLGGVPEEVTFESGEEEVTFELGQMVGWALGEHSRPETPRPEPVFLSGNEIPTNFFLSHGELSH